MTVLGPTPDAEYLGATYPHAVREWCVNSCEARQFGHPQHHRL